MSRCKFSSYGTPLKPASRRLSGFGLRAAALSLSTILAACAVGPDYQTPDMKLPGKWGNSNSETPPRPPELAYWWVKLGDPKLDQLILQAISGSLDVKQAKARVREARASLVQTNSAMFPRVDGAGSAVRRETSSNAGGQGSVRNLFSAGFDASWELDLFGANRRASEAARYGLDAAEEDLRSTLLTLVGDIATNYVEARGYQARLRLAKRTASSQTETANLTRRRFQAGTSSGVDVANAEGQASSTKANIPSLQSAYMASVHRLSVLSGQEPNALIPLMKASVRIPRPKLPIPVGVPATVLLTRPDVRLAERRLAQSTALIGAAEAARYPAISLTGNIATSALKVGDLGKNSSLSWSFGPSLSVPVFNGGKLAAATDVARAQRDQSFLTYQSAVLTALEDVENALVVFSQERIRQRSLAKAASSYRQAADLLQTRYKTGTVSFLDVLDAQRSTYSAEDALIRSQVTLATNFISLNKALGGGWDGDVDTRTPEVIDKNTGPRLALKKQPAS
jgi:outer membrane protein, multidrug efflux system